MVLRVIVQRFRNAKLLVNNADAWAVAPTPGLVLYVAFLKGSTAAVIPKAVASLLSARLLDNGRASVTDMAVCDPSQPPTIMVIPQAALGGHLKGKAVQYHGLVPRADGCELYAEFVRLLREAAVAAAERGTGAAALPPTLPLPDGATAGAGIVPFADGATAAAGKATAGGGAAAGVGAGGGAGAAAAAEAVDAAGATAVTGVAGLAYEGGVVPVDGVAVVLAGGYGNRQGFVMESDGPNTHCLEFS